MTSAEQSEEKKSAALVLEALLHERVCLREDIVLMQRSMHQTIFAFVAVAGVAAGIYFNEKIVASDTRPIILFALTQAEVFLALFALALIGNQNVHVGYCRAVERQINAVLGGNVVIWESEIVPAFIFHPRGTFFWSYILFSLSLVAVFIVFVAMAFQHVNQLAFGVVLTIELIALIVLTVFVHIEPFRVARYADGRIRIPESARANKSPNADAPPSGCAPVG